MISSVSIDDFVVQYGITDLQFIKMDIEGAEDFVFEGATGTLDTYAPDILLEVHQTVNCAALFRFFDTRGYRWFDETSTRTFDVNHDRHYLLTKRETL